MSRIERLPPCRCESISTAFATPKKTLTVFQRTLSSHLHRLLRLHLVLAYPAMMLPERGAAACRWGSRSHAKRDCEHSNVAFQHECVGCFAAVGLSG